ncbi:MAG: divergent polysaccharide deacetylase family protein [Proteobacteria bacterium]|nr:divergent polysaccharide deacetylase family protein [Pseudomonadota bacterium]MBU1386289.1 divergent polysaccharide deacetylase family protein [Pseudomonadota bacterium]MBU1542981.1 divergent polysaccharide deacetylase family protein [Pseudomonadota bacterium]MBU2429330.1 divergent polysaccharide deacetylase family protein [Pseudomonadota bacterium]MBU2480004.1 divergent polysaccharide deacetylase family protein [Pseudomonadota bacterium]
MAVKKKVLSKKNTLKKAGPKKKSVTKRAPRILRQNSTGLDEFKKVFLGLAILLALCLTVAMIADIFLKPGLIKRQSVLKKTEPETIQPIQEGIVAEVKKKAHVKGLKEKNNVPDLADKAVESPKKTPPPAEKTIEYEVFDDVDHSPTKKPVPPVKDHVPKIAIIIDDIGYDRKIARALSDLNPDITFSVLPFSPFGKSISEKLHQKGFQLMLHLPMEPVEYPDVNPGPGAILSTMPPDVLLENLKKAIQDVPYVEGVNNHMGSKLTMQSDQMNQIFTILKKDNLFFIDSRTAPKSACKASARLLQIRFAQRDVFLDNVQDEKYITGQFKQLIRHARKHGFAIGIGHPYKATLDALSKEIPKLEGTVRIVRARELTTVLEM